ncbi:MAG TPA: hypothetical protein VLG71_02035 [Candidatus Limnocylindria bacterium]|nr:hypothetical protein [Candidatus Limnocylindria bacterium]
MKAVEKIQSFIDSLEERTFYAYLAGFAGFALIFAVLIIFFYYRSLAHVEDQINFINDKRIEVKRLLTTYEQVKRQRNEVDTLFGEDVGFKIAGYFTSLLARLNLQDKKTTTDQISRVEHEGKYQETVLKAQLTDMNMKELCVLLSEIEHNKRIYTKELDITKSKKKPRALDITLTIAALEPKT